jgi:hypothetical protein
MQIQRLIVSNWLALVASFIAHFALGMAWYGVFATPWMASIGKTMDQLASVPQSVYGLTVLTTIAITLGIAKVMDLAGERGVAAGVKWALFLWVFISLPFPLLHYAFAGSPPSLLLIDGGYELAGAVLTGVCVGLFGFRTSLVRRPVVAPAVA